MKKLCCVIFAAAILLSACKADTGGDDPGVPEESISPIAGGISTGFPDPGAGIDIPEDIGESLPGETEEPLAEGDYEKPAEPDIRFTVSEDPAETQEYAESDEVTLTVAEKYREVVIIKMENLTGENVDIGTIFSVEVKTDGAWHRLESVGGPMFPMTNVWLEAGGTAYDLVNLDAFFGDLPDGEYRITRDFNKESDYNNPVCLAAEFSLGSEDVPGKPGIPETWGYILGREGEKTAEGLELNVKEGENTASDGGGVKLILKNGSDADAEYGMNFRLLRLIGNRWYYIRETVDNRPSPAVLLTTPAGGESELDWVKWTQFYGELPDGRYAVEIPVTVAGAQKYVFCADVLVTENGAE